MLLLVSSSLIAQASVAPVEQINYDWYDATIETIVIPYEPPVYTFYTVEENSDYMESVFLPNLTNATLIDTRTAHGVNSYSYTVAPGERINITYIYLTPENTITITGGYAPSNATFCVGISNGNYRKQIYPNESGYSSAFSVPSNGTYEIFIQNT